MLQILPKEHNSVHNGGLRDKNECADMCTREANV